MGKNLVVHSMINRAILGAYRLYHSEFRALDKAKKKAMFSTAKDLSVRNEVILYEPEMSNNFC